jgi:hypothetical protein
MVGPVIAGLPCCLFVVFCLPRLLLDLVRQLILTIAWLSGQVSGLPTRDSGLIRVRDQRQCGSSSRLSRRLKTLEALNRKGRKGFANGREE